MPQAWQGDLRELCQGSRDQRNLRDDDRLVHDLGADRGHDRCRVWNRQRDDPDQCEQVPLAAVPEPAEDELARRAEPGCASERKTPTHV
jgi:hypothetical protein